LNQFVLSGEGRQDPSQADIGKHPQASAHPSGGHQQHVAEFLFASASYLDALDLQALYGWRLLDDFASHTCALGAGGFEGAVEVTQGAHVGGHGCAAGKEVSL
jgi:hypothetical protein